MDIRFRDPIEDWRFVANEVLAVHGMASDNVQPDQSSIIPYMRGLFPERLRQGNRPHYTLKTFYTAQWKPNGVEAEMRQAQAAGYDVCLQVLDRDDEPVSQGVLKCTAVLETLRDRGLVPAKFIYGNEDDITATDAEHYAEKKVEVLKRIELPWQTQLVLATYSSWSAALDDAPDMVQAAQRAGLRYAPELGVHEYGSAPTLFTRLGLPGIFRAVTGCDPFINESDIDFFTADRWNEKGAAYACWMNLEYACEGLPCADFTIQTTDAGQNGNGLWKADGSAHPSGEAYEKCLSQFTRVPIRRLFTDPYNVGFSAYENTKGEVVVIRYAREATKYVQDAYGILRWGRSDFGFSAEAIALAALTAFVPDDPLGYNEWPRLKRIVGNDRANELAEGVTVKLPRRLRRITRIIHTLGDVERTFEGPHMGPQSLVYYA